MNTLLMLVLAVQAPAADMPPVIQTQVTYGPPVSSTVTGPISSSGPMTQGMPPVVTTSEGAYDDSGWWSRFRNRPGLFTRLRNYFGGSSNSEPVVSSPGMSYSNGVPMSGSWNEGRLTPVPMMSPSISTTPSITTAPSFSTPPPPVINSGSGSSHVPTTVDADPPQRMPSGR